MKYKSTICILLFFPALVWEQKHSSTAQRPKVLFLFVDDLRPELDHVQLESFVQQFREHGYYTVGIGKISHSPDG